ncbi:hypothetical protein STENM327S_07133 [Streptomyces tendae]
MSRSSCRATSIRSATWLSDGWSSAASWNEEITVATVCVALMPLPFCDVPDDHPDAERRRADTVEVPADERLVVRRPVEAGQAMG